MGGLDRRVPETGRDRAHRARAVRARGARTLSASGSPVLAAAGISGRAREWRVAADAVAPCAGERGVVDLARVLWSGTSRTPRCDRDALGRDARHQGVSDADHARDVQRAAGRAVPVRADTIVRVPVESHRAGAAAASVAPDGQCRGFCGVADRGAARGARCADLERICDGRASPDAAGADALGAARRGRG